MELIIIFSLILLNGIFAMSEMALVSSKRFKLENAKKKGTSGAKAALDLADEPTKFLSTVQIGITLIGILLGVFSGEKLTEDVVSLVSKIPFLEDHAPSIAVGVIVVCITFFSIVFGELFPKRLGMTFPEPIAILMSRPMLLISKITAPFVWLLTATNNTLSKLFGIHNRNDNSVSEDEIKAMVREGAVGGEILDIEHDIVERVFELGDRKVGTLLTHRSDIVYLDVSDSWSEVKTKINADKHSAYPVCKNDDLDQLVGIALLKDLFQGHEQENFNLSSIVKEPVNINENMYAYKVLELFRKQKMHNGIVYDEYGTILGIVTMDDVLDALVGDVTEMEHDEYQIMKRNETSWIVDGQYSVINFIEYFDDVFEIDYEDKFNTVGGFLLSLFNKMPSVGDKVVFDDYEFEIMDKDGQRIDKILMTKVKAQSK